MKIFKWKLYSLLLISFVISPMCFTGALTFSVSLLTSHVIHAKSGKKLDAKQLKKIRKMSVDRSYLNNQKIRRNFYDSIKIPTEQLINTTSGRSKALKFYTAINYGKSSIIDEISKLVEAAEKEGKEKESKEKELRDALSCLAVIVSVSIAGTLFPEFIKIDDNIPRQCFDKKSKKETVELIIKLELHHRCTNSSFSKVGYGYPQQRYCLEANEGRSLYRCNQAVKRIEPYMLGNCIGTVVNPNIRRKEFIEYLKNLDSLFSN